jgi:hypothetical protein
VNHGVTAISKLVFEPASLEDLHASTSGWRGSSSTLWHDRTRDRKAGASASAKETNTKEAETAYVGARGLLTSLRVSSRSRALSATIQLLARIAISRSSTISSTRAWTRSALRPAQLRHGISTRRVPCQTSKPNAFVGTSISQHAPYDQRARVAVSFEVVAAYDLLVLASEIDAIPSHGTLVNVRSEWPRSPRDS